MRAWWWWGVAGVVPPVAAPAPFWMPVSQWLGCVLPTGRVWLPQGLHALLVLMQLVHLGYLLPGPLL
jgi:hypothetical protein